MSQTGQGENIEEFERTPEGIAKRIAREFESTKKAQEKWHKTARKIVDEFLDKSAGESGDSQRRQDSRKLNLFWSDVTLQECLLLGKLPKCDVSRSFGDAKDQVGRVAGELLERQLNCDIERPTDSYAFALWSNLKDWRTVGLGVQKFRYCCEMEPTEGKPAIPAKEDGTGGAPAVPPGERKCSEDVETDYVYWEDVRWSAGARIWPQIRWLAFKSEMRKEELCKRFAIAVAKLVYGPGEQGDEEDDGDEVATDEEWYQLGEELLRTVPLSARKGEGAKDDPSAKKDPWSRAEVWEFWDKTDGMVYWYVDGFPHILDAQEDPLGLRNFFPCQRFLVDNWTTREFMPRPTWVLCQDLYTEINELQSRLSKLVREMKVRGVYDASSQELVRLIGEANDGEMLPVRNFRMFEAKGGVQGTFAMFPLDQIAKAILDLRSELTNKKAELREVSGMGDIIRGEAVKNGTPGEAQIEAHFASARMQAIQNEFARFASEGQAIRAEIIANLFDEQTIIERSNAMATFEDPALVQQAVELIKSRHSDYRITIKPESVALDDYAAMKAEAVDLIDALSKFMSLAAPLAQASPQAMPAVSELFAWAIARVKGGKEIEGVVTQLGQALAQTKPPQQQGDGGAAAQAQIQREQLKQQGDLKKIQAETAADAQRDASQARQEASDAQAEHQLEMQADRNRMELEVEKAAKIEQIKTQAEIHRRAVAPPPAPPKEPTP